MSYTDTPYPMPQPGVPTPPPTRGGNGLATAGFVLGLLGFLICWIPLLNIIGILLGVLGAVLAAVGLAKSKKAGAGKGLAIAGLVLGVLAVIIAIVVNVAFVDAVDDALDETTNTSVKPPSDSDDDSGAEDDAAPAEKDLGSTRQTPAPIGSEITGGDWTVTINSVKTIKEDSIGQTPKAGSTLIMVNMTATYNGNDDQGESAWANVKFVAADGTTFDSLEGSTLFMAENGFDSLRTLYKGASVTGDEILEVPAKGWQDGVLAVSADLLKDDTFISVK